MPYIQCTRQVRPQEISCLEWLPRGKYLVRVKRWEWETEDMAMHTTAEALAPFLFPEEADNV